jgi:hypothetical protein
MPKEIITSATAPTTGFSDKATPSPLAQGIKFGNMMFVSGRGRWTRKPRRSCPRISRNRRSRR